MRWHDLHRILNEELLEHFYENLLVPNFGIIPEELDPLWVWSEGLEVARKQASLRLLKGVHPPKKITRQQAHESDEQPFCTMLLTVLTYEESENVEESGGGTASTESSSAFAAAPGLPIGGCAYELYRSGFALVSYWIVARKYRGLGCGKALLQHAFEECLQRAMFEKRNCLGLFAESNAPHVNSKQDIVEPWTRLLQMKKRGFFKVPIDFIHPPLKADDEPLRDTLWLLFKPASSFENENDHLDDDEEVPAVPAQKLCEFLEQYFSSC